MLILGWGVGKSIAGFLTKDKKSLASFCTFLPQTLKSMANNIFSKMWSLIGLRYKSHPWHGIEIGADAPEVVTCFIEMTPSDSVKYEVDKATGYLKVDRPQKFSNIVPALYGFVPQTYCDAAVAEYCMEKSGKKDIVGDDDPLDICVLTERNITHGDLMVQALPIGGFRMIDGGEADDKIIAILKGDEVYQDWKDVSDCPASLINRLHHYFLTYKQMPGEDKTKCEITHIYGREEALEVIRRSQQDYKEKFGKLENKLSMAMLNAINFGQSWQDAFSEDIEES
jgi:inorganic pyrophosphatase